MSISIKTQNHEFLTFRAHFVAKDKADIQFNLRISSKKLIKKQTVSLYLNSGRMTNIHIEKNIYIDIKVQ